MIQTAHTTDTVITDSEARKICKANKIPLPYRGYGRELQDGRFIACRPDGKFIVRTKNSTASV